MRMCGVRALEKADILSLQSNEFFEHCRDVKVQDMIAMFQKQDFHEHALSSFVSFLSLIFGGQENLSNRENQLRRQEF